MRISNEQIALMKKSNKKGMIYLYTLNSDQNSVVKYLKGRIFVELGFNNNQEYFKLSQKGKAYLYEYKDMMRQRYLATCLSISAFIISTMSLIVSVFSLIFKQN